MTGAATKLLTALLLLLLLTDSCVCIQDVGILLREAAAGSEQEAVNAGPQHGALPLVALVVEHAHPGLLLPVYLAFFGFDLELAGDCSLCNG